ncbi:MAG TPA: CoxE, partial [Solirubrobacterales bacterium]|nr:CoxE [Solirubrobacterales bacterium]
MPTPYGPKADPGPPGLAPKLLGFCEELRSEGVAVGTSEILDAFAALEQVEWTAPADFREALATTIAKSQDDRRVFELLFDRYFFRAAEAEAVQREISEEAEGGGGEGGEGGERLDMDELREQIREAIMEGDEDKLRDLARLAIAAFGRGEGSGVVGVDVQRIRRTLGLTAGQQPPTEDGRELPPIDRDQLNAFERHLRRELERDLIER